MQPSETCRQENITRLLFHRETAQRVGGRIRERAPCLCTQGGLCTCSRSVSTKDLPRWAESDFLRRCSATYSPLRPAPRSTIAAAFSPDGKLLASTHGDHTVKIICCHTGKCIQTLLGHRRTPWVVRFHPHSSNLLASGSLDHDVRLWNARTGECINTWDFGRPISSLAFHCQGDVLAIASGHRLHLWEYDKGVNATSSVPNTCLRTRRSLRAVHFHPHGAPLLLTAEVNDPELQDFPPSQALSEAGSAQGVFEHSRAWDTSYVMTASGATVPRRSASGPIPSGAVREGARHGMSGLGPGAGGAGNTNRSWQGDALRSAGDGSEMGDSGPGGPPPTTATTAAASAAASQPGSSSASDGSPVRQRPPAAVRRRAGDSPEMSDVSMGSATTGGGREGTVSQMDTGGSGEAQLMEVDSVGNAAPSRDQQQRHRSQPPRRRRSLHLSHGEQTVDGAGLPPTLVPMGWELPAEVLQRNILQHQQASNGQGGHESLYPAATGAGGHMSRGAPPPGGGAQASAEAVAVATAAAAAIVGHERPCTVKLRLWAFDTVSPRKILEVSRLTISHAVLCSEMGVHFSPCGRYLAACVACQAPDNDESEARSGGAVSAPVYELRVFSLEKESFGRVLRARQIRAAHCLTSIQFSPASEHLLLAYGRRHISLLRSLVADGGSIIPVHTILEVYRVSDMSLVRVLPSAEDEVNVAAFHPREGGGIVYGTKEGRLRILRHDRTPPCLVPDSHSGRSLEYELLEADQMASEASDSDEDSI